jgi:hypothetical protein
MDWVETRSRLHTEFCGVPLNTGISHTMTGSSPWNSVWTTVPAQWQQRSTLKFRVALHFTELTGSFLAVGHCWYLVQPAWHVHILQACHLIRVRGACVVSFHDYYYRKVSIYVSPISTIENIISDYNGTNPLFTQNISIYYIVILCSVRLISYF